MRVLRIIVLAFIVVSCQAQPTTHQSLTERQKSEMAEFKSHNKVKGLAFALFTNDSVIWQQCLGKSSYGSPVNDTTLFSIQSVSKNFTAMAVMMALQDHMLDLNRPVSSYLPDFRINSCYEDNPQDKITLRMLLSHTAGLTHEAPAGNNYDFSDCSFDQHIKSISDTWLKFPPGEGYSYSNLGVDLAASVVEKQSAMSFDAFMRKKIFDPLGMKYTTIEDEKVVNNHNRTEGDIKGTRAKHVKIPLMGSGAVYTNLSEMIKYTRFQMNQGRYGGRELISRGYLDTMYTIISRNYALGTYIGRDNNTWYINHNGGGYGYSASMVFFPEYNLGAVMLCNKPVNCFSFASSIMDEHIRKTGMIKDTMITKEMDRLNGRYLSAPDSFNDFKPACCPGDTLYKDEWNKYTGRYILKLINYDFRGFVRVALSLGFFHENVHIFKANQTLVLEYNGGHSVLREYEPGLFFTTGGEAVDFRGRTVSFKNIGLKKIR